MARQSAFRLGQRPRELRRRVLLRARVQASSGWSDVCILNVSSRGLMINAPSVNAEKGSTIELRYSEHMIVATIVWRDGSRAGLKADERVPVDDLLARGQSPSLQLTAGGWPHIDRRARPRSSGDARLRGRIIEFAGIVLIGASLAVGATLMIGQAFAQPIRHVQAALGG